MIANIRNAEAINTVIADTDMHKTGRKQPDALDELFVEGRVSELE